MRPGFDPWVGKTPWRRERLATQISWPGELYSPWGLKESDTTERLSLSLVEGDGRSNNVSFVLEQYPGKLQIIELLKISQMWNVLQSFEVYSSPSEVYVHC